MAPYDSEQSMIQQPVNLHKVVEELQTAMDDYGSFIHRVTGRLVAVSLSLLSALEESDEDDDMDMAAPHGWQTTEVAIAVEICSDPDNFIRLPDQFDIDDRSIMEKFSYTVSDPERRGALQYALRGPRAFGRFRDAVWRMGLIDDWHAFYDAALEEIARDFLDENGILYTNEKPAGEIPF